MADRISTLPDPIISHILSFLPTEEAVATSLLSKRWIPLWRQIPILNFNDKNYCQDKETYFRFVQFVSRFMELRDRELLIKEFNLTCGTTLCPPSKAVCKWVMAANKCKTQHLSLSMPCYTTISLPLSVFSSTTLVVLKLRGISVNHISSVSFPSLKTLHLTFLFFKTQEFLVKFLVEILSACPILEVLLMRVLQYPDYFDGDFIVIEPHMLELYFPKLVQVDTCEFNFYVTFPLQPFRTVQRLRSSVDEKLVKNLILSTHNFPNLISLEIPVINYVYTLNWLVELLHCCPRLQHLEILQMCSYYRRSPDDEKLVELPQAVPECLLSTLKSFRLIRYEGKNCERQFTRFIIQNGRVLRKVTISNLENLLEKELSSCPRASPTCQLYFQR